MADVGAGEPSAGRRRSTARTAAPPAADPDRGQLILVTALSLAILFVALALILNTAIYTENLATRSSDIGGGTDAVRYHDAARAGVGGVIDYVNAHNDTDNAALHANLSAGVAAFSNGTSRQFDYSDRAVATTLNETVYGTRIAQDDPNRNFSNVSGASDWTVAPGVTGTRAFVINLTDVGSCSVITPCLDVDLTDGSGNTWNLSVTSTSVQVTNTTGATFTCPSPSPNPVVDLTAGTVDGERCDGLTFADGLSTPYDIAFQHAGTVNGTYSLVVDDPSLANAPGPNLAAEGSGKQPYAAHAIYAVTVDVVYDTPRLRYRATVRVAPGEP